MTYREKSTGRIVEAIHYDGSSESLAAATVFADGYITKGRPGTKSDGVVWLSWITGTSVELTAGDWLIHYGPGDFRLRSPGEFTADYQIGALARECHGASSPVDETLFFGL